MVPSLAAALHTRRATLLTSPLPNVTARRPPWLRTRTGRVCSVDPPTPRSRVFFALSPNGLRPVCRVPPSVLTCVFVCAASGVLKFFGPTKASKGGKRCGVALEAANGTHDGTVNGTRYFTCADGHGCLVKIDKVTIVEDGGLCVSSALPHPCPTPSLSFSSLRLCRAQLARSPSLASFFSLLFSVRACCPDIANPLLTPSHLSLLRPPEPPPRLPSPFFILSRLSRHPSFVQLQPAHHPPPPHPAAGPKGAKARTSRTERAAAAAAAGSDHQRRFDDRTATPARPVPPLLTPFGSPAAPRVTAPASIRPGRRRYPRWPRPGAGGAPREGRLSSGSPSSRSALHEGPPPALSTPPP